MQRRIKLKFAVQQVIRLRAKSKVVVYCVASFPIALPGGSAEELHGQEFDLVRKNRDYISRR